MIMRKTKKEVLSNGERIFNIKRIVIEMNERLDAIIVEGKKDENVFTSLGFKKKIVKCSSKDLESIEREIRDVKYKNYKIKVAIFTDFDERGKYLNKKIKAYLQQRGIIIENFYRSKIKDIAFDVKEIEDLNKRVADFKNKIPYGDLYE